MQPGRLRWLVAAVVVVLALVWWATRSSTRAVDEVASKTTAVENVPAVAPLVAPTGESESSMRSSTSVASETEHTVVAASAESSDDWIVLVIDAVTKEPVAGAEVAWMSEIRIPRERSRPLVALDPEALLDPDARWVRADADGRVRIPPDELPGFVCARHGDAFGSRNLFARDVMPIEVVVRRALHVDIQVVDSAGRPVADVPVSLRSSSGRSSIAPIWSGITAGANGIARARHFEQSLERLPSPLELVADLEFPTRTFIPLPVDIDSLPSQPIRLVLPPAGSVELLVRDSVGGDALPRAVHMNVAVPGDEDMFKTPDLRQFEPTLIEKGHVHFPFVETGLELTAQVVVNMAFFHANRPGPRVNGEHVTIEFDTGPARPTIVGRLVDMSGQPLVDANVQYAMHAPTARSSAPIKTDALGRFEITSPAEPHNPLVGTLLLRPFGHRSGAEQLGTIELNGPLHEGVNEFGDIVVLPLLVLVTGTIVDENDVPIVKGSVAVDIDRSTSGDPIWDNDGSVSATRGANGVFTILGAAPRARLRLRPILEGFVSLSHCEVVSGARDVKLVLARAAELAGSVGLESDIPFKDVTVIVRALTDHAGRWTFDRPHEWANVREDGTFKLTGVRPLVVELAVRKSGVKDPIVVVPNLDLRGGGPATDPRLKGIDLRGIFRPRVETRAPAEY